MIPKTTTYTDHGLPITIELVPREKNEGRDYFVTTMGTAKEAFIRISDDGTSVDRLMRTVSAVSLMQAEYGRAVGMPLLDIAEAISFAVAIALVRTGVVRAPLDEFLEFLARGDSERAAAVGIPDVPPDPTAN